MCDRFMCMKVIVQPQVSFLRSYLIFSGRISHWELGLTDCDGLNENSFHRLISLNSGSPVGQTGQDWRCCWRRCVTGADFDLEVPKAHGITTLSLSPLFSSLCLWIKM